MRFLTILLSIALSLHLGSGIAPAGPPTHPTAVTHPSPSIARPPAVLRPTHFAPQTVDNNPVSLRYPTRSYHPLFAFSFFRRVLPLFEPLISFIPGGGVVHEVVRRAAVQVGRGTNPAPTPSEDPPTSPTANLHDTLHAIEQDVASQRRELQDHLTNASTKADDIRAQLEDAAHRRHRELRTLSYTILESTQDIATNLAVIDNNLDTMDQTLHANGETLADLQQQLSSVADTIDRDLRDIAVALYAVLDEARESNARLSALEEDLDTFAAAILAVALLNAALVVVLLSLVLKLERNLRYAIDLLKIILIDMKIPIPDPHLGPLGRMRRWCNARAYWRWLPHATTFIATALAAVLVSIVVLGIVDPAYLAADAPISATTLSDGASQAPPQPGAYWPLTVVAAAAVFLVARRLRQPAPLGAPVLALVPIDATSPTARGTLLVRDNGLLRHQGGFVIGRHASLVDVVIADDTVSRRQARITRDHGGQFYVEDLNASNRTILDGRRLQPFHPCPLGLGQRLKLGDLVLSVEPIQ